MMPLNLTCLHVFIEHLFNLYFIFLLSNINVSIDFNVIFFSFQLQVIALNAALYVENFDTDNWPTWLRGWVTIAIVLWQKKPHYTSYVTFVPTYD